MATVTKTQVEILTPEETAYRLKVSVATVWRWARDGKIPRLKGAGKTVRFRWEAVLAALEGKKKEPKQS